MPFTSATSARPRPADASTISRSIRRTRPSSMSARRRGGIWKSTNKGVTWKDVFGKQPDNTFGALAIFEGDTKIIWAGTGETEQPPELVVGRRRVPLDRRRRDVDVSRPARHARRSAASCSIPTDPERRLRRRGRESLGRNRRARRLQDDRRRSHVDQGALRRYVHRRDRPRDGSARPEGAVRRDLSAAAQGVRLQRRRPGQRDLQDAPTPARRGRSSRTAFPPATRAASAWRIAQSKPDVLIATIEHADRGRHVSHRRRRRDVEADERDQSAADVLQQADHRSQQRQARLAARHLHRQERGRRHDVRGGADLADLRRRPEDRSPRAARRSRELEPHLRRRRRRAARELRHGEDLHPREQHPGRAGLSHRRRQPRSVLGLRRAAGQPLVDGPERDAPLARHPEPGLGRDRLQRRHRQSRRQGRLAQGLFLVEQRQPVAGRSDDRRHDGHQPASAGGRAGLSLRLGRAGDGVAAHAGHGVSRRQPPVHLAGTTARRGRAPRT